MHNPEDTAKSRKAAVAKFLVGRTLSVVHGCFQREKSFHAAIVVCVAIGVC
jgi:hypothetical protein